MDRLDELQIRQLDTTLAKFAPLRTFSPPHEGWIKAIRMALGMSIRQLAARTGLSKTSVDSAESNEAKGTIQMESLKRLAEGLDCELVYALVPRDSLKRTIERQAASKAAVLVGRVSDSMDLESQGISEKERRRQSEELKAEFIQNRDRHFWDV